MKLQIFAVSMAIASSFAMAAVNGPGTSTIGNVSLWDDATGTLLANSKLFSDANGNLRVGAAFPATQPSAGGNLMVGKTIIHDGILGFGYYENSSGDDLTLTTFDGPSRFQCHASGYCTAAVAISSPVVDTPVQWKETVDLRGGLWFKAFNGTNLRAVGKLTQSTSSVGNVGTTETTIGTANLGEGFGWGGTHTDNMHNVEASGTFADNSNDKRIRCYSGPTASPIMFFDSGVINPEGGTWSLKSNVYVNNEASQTVSTTLIGDTISNIVKIESTSPTTVSGGYIVKCTVTGEVDDDITGKTFHMLHSF